MTREVYLIDGSRTPFIKAGAKPNAWSAADLAVAATEALLARQPFPASNIGEVIFGCVGPSAAEVNIGRIIGLRSGCGNSVPGWTVQRNCASGLQAIDCGSQDIAVGRHDLVIAGGTEAMSRAAFLFSDEFVRWLADFNAAKTLGAKIQIFFKLRPKYLMPVFSLLQALNDPVVNLSMGQTAEKIAFQFGITRTEMDEYSVQSHQRVIDAYNNKYFVGEVIPLFDWLGNVLEADNGVRADSNIAKLATLKPVFDKPFGLVTAGNSSQVSDGAAVVLLASKDAVKQYNLKPLAKIIDFAWAALDPSVMGLGPAYAIAELLIKNNLRLEDIDYFEINEAFAGQVIACLRALADSEFCQQNLNAKQAFGTIALDRLNIDGGAIAIGHPVGASGTRLTLHLAHILRRKNAKLGIASLCIGGGQGGAVLIESVKESN